KSQYCYRCSATHYSNPSKPILVETAKKFSRALISRTLEDKFSPEKAVEIRTKLSERMIGEHNHMFGRRPPHRKGGYRQDLGHYVRSNWEADFARVLQWKKLEYKYEPETFEIQLDNGDTVH